MRVGAVSHLNALPLIHGLPWQVTRLSPTVLQKAFLEGHYDIALCSITTALCHPDTFILPGMAIGSHGAVDSVRLIFRDGVRDLQQCRRIALDPESNTANLLFQVLLVHYYQRPMENITWVRPEEHPDAYLIIGDRALVADRDKGAIDLGAVWTEWTGLPFVFAAWLTRTSTIATDIVECLTAVRDRNLFQLEELVTRLAPAQVRERLGYLREHISYRLDDAELQGIARFHQALVELGLAPDRPLPLATPMA